MSSKPSLAWGSVCIVIAAFLWATDLFFRYDLLKILDPVSLVFLEHLLILMVLCPLFLSALIPLFKLNRNYLFALLFIGIGGSAIGTVTFSYAFANLNPVVPIILQKLQPFVVLVGAHLLLKESHPRYFYFWAALAVLGAVLLSEPYLGSFVLCVQDMSQCVLSPATDNLASGQPPPVRPAIAVISALIAVVCWGLSTVFGRFVSTQLSPRHVTFLRVFFGFLALFFWVMWVGAYEHLFQFSEQLIHTPVLGAKLLYMALVIGLVGLVFYYQGMRRVPAKLATVLELFYPVFSVILATVVLQQPMNWIQIVGMGCIVSASLLCTWRGFA